MMEWAFRAARSAMMSEALADVLFGASTDAPTEVIGAGMTIATSPVLDVAFPVASGVA